MYHTKILFLFCRHIKGYALTSVYKCETLIDTGFLKQSKVAKQAQQTDYRSNEESVFSH